MEVSVITYKSNYTSSRQLHLITGGVPCQVIKSIRMQPKHSEDFITITRAALKQDVAKNEFSNAHSNANLPCYIHFPNYDREIRLHSHSPARIKQASAKREKFPVNPGKNQPKMLQERINIYIRFQDQISPFPSSLEIIKEKEKSTINCTRMLRKYISKYIVLI